MMFTLIFTRFYAVVITEVYDKVYAIFLMCGIYDIFLCNGVYDVFVCDGVNNVFFMR